MKRGSAEEDGSSVDPRNPVRQNRLPNAEILSRRVRPFHIHSLPKAGA